MTSATFYHMPHFKKSRMLHICLSLVALLARAVVLCLLQQKHLTGNPHLLWLEGILKQQPVLLTFFIISIFTTPYSGDLTKSYCKKRVSDISYWSLTFTRKKPFHHTAKVPGCNLLSFYKAYDCIPHLFIPAAPLMAEYRWKPLNVCFQNSLRSSPVIFFFFS